jgi:VWFA-related protein
LDVVVTDKHDQPGTDLKPDEITIVEQGKPQKLASFSFVDGKVTLKGVAVPERALIPGVYYNGPEAEAAKGPITVLLLDALNTSFADRKSGRQQMLKYIDGHQGDRLAIFGLTDSLLLLQNFTSDQKKLHETIDLKGVRQAPMHPDETPDSGGVSSFAVHFPKPQLGTELPP